MEIRPFRALRYSPQVLADRGLATLIRLPGATGDERPAENASALLFPAGKSETLRAWTAAGTLIKERRPALWAYRQTIEENGRTHVLDLLIALVRLSESVQPAQAGPPPAERSKRVGWIAEMKADFEPSLVATRAPLSAAVSSTRPPDLSAVDGDGVRHDVRRLPEFAQHVELQGLLKSAEAYVLAGTEAFEAARQFAGGPAAARLPGARYKLCAIVEEGAWKERGTMPIVPAGLVGYSLEDAVY